MARIESTYTETAEGRDKGKKFLITEMDVYSGFDWASRLLMTMANSGANIPPETMRSGMAGVASMIFSKGDLSQNTLADGIALAMNMVGRMPHHMAKPLMDELMACIQVVADNGTVRSIFPGDIEEVLTLFRLQRAAFLLHVGPFAKGVQSISESETTA